MGLIERIMRRREKEKDNPAERERAEKARQAEKAKRRAEKARRAEDAARRKRERAEKAKQVAAEARRRKRERRLGEYVWKQLKRGASKAVALFCARLKFGTSPTAKKPVTPLERMESKGLSKGAARFAATLKVGKRGERREMGRPKDAPDAAGRPAGEPRKDRAALVSTLGQLVVAKRKYINWLRGHGREKGEAKFAGALKYGRRIDDLTREIAAIDSAA